VDYSWSFSTVNNKRNGGKEIKLKKEHSITLHFHLLLSFINRQRNNIRKIIRAEAKETEPPASTLGFPLKSTRRIHLIFCLGLSLQYP